MPSFDENMAILNTFDDMAVESRENIIRAPFGYPGGKQRAIWEILPHLPYRNCYVEPFGGSGSILLARHESPVEVLNDRFMGVVAFYRCIRDKELCQKLRKRLELVCHSREEFNWCKQTWKEVSDDVERAARWYYMVQASFGCLGRNFARTIASKSTLGDKLHNNLCDFDRLHRRMRNVQVENLDWKVCVKDFDSPDTVFYMDPPYFQYSGGIYEFRMSQADHVDFLNRIFELQGFVAVSGYANEIYDSYKWDHKHSWNQFVSVTSLAKQDSNNLMDRPMVRGDVKECLWIKEST